MDRLIIDCRTAKQYLERMTKEEEDQHLAERQARLAIDLDERIQIVTAQLVWAQGELDNAKALHAAGVFTQADVDMREGRLEMLKQEYGGLVSELERMNERRE